MNRSCRRLCSIAASCLLVAGGTANASAQEVEARSSAPQIFPSLFVQMSGRSVGATSHLGAGKVALSVTPGVTLRSASAGPWRGSLGLGVEIEPHALPQGSFATYLMPTLRLGASYHGVASAEPASTLAGAAPDLFPSLHLYALFGARSQRPWRPGTARVGLGLSSPWMPGVGAMLAGLPSSYEVVYETGARGADPGSLWVRFGLGF